MRPASAMPLALIMTAGSRKKFSSLDSRVVARVAHHFKAKWVSMPIASQEFVRFFVVCFWVQAVNAGGINC